MSLSTAYSPKMKMSKSFGSSLALAQEEGGGGVGGGARGEGGDGDNNNNLRHSYFQQPHQHSGDEQVHRRHGSEPILIQFETTTTTTTTATPGGREKKTKKCPEKKRKEQKEQKRLVSKRIVKKTLRPYPSPETSSSSPRSSSSSTNCSHDSSPKSDERTPLTNGTSSIDSYDTTTMMSSHRGDGSSINGDYSKENVNANAGVPRLSRTLLTTICVVTIGSSLQFGYGTGVMNNSEAYIMKYFHDRGKSYTVMNWGTTVSCYGVGGLFGSILGPKVIGSFYGRRETLLINNIFLIISSILIAFAPKWYYQAMGRIFVGIVAGISTAVVPTYFSEISPKEVRGAVGTMHQLGITLGILLSQALSTPSLNMLGSEEKWKWLFLVPVLCGLFEIFILPFCPESPSYLFVTKGEEAARQALVRLQSEDVADEYLNYIKEEVTLASSSNTMDIVKKKDPESTIETGDGTFFVEDNTISDIWIENGTSSSNSNNSSGSAANNDAGGSGGMTVYELFADRNLRKQLIVGITVQLMMQFSGIDAVFYYSTSVFYQANVSNPELATTALGVINVLVTIVAVRYMDTAGRKTLLIYSWIGMCTSYIILTLAFICKPYFQFMDQVSIIATTGVIIFFAFGPGCIAWFIIAEIFPLKARDTAMSVGIFINWIANWLVAFIFPLLLIYTQPFTFIIFVATTAYFLYFTIHFVPETKGLTVSEVTKEFDRMHLSCFAC